MTDEGKELRMRLAKALMELGEAMLVLERHRDAGRRFMHDVKAAKALAPMRRVEPAVRTADELAEAERRRSA